MDIYFGHFPIFHFWQQFSSQNMYILYYELAYCFLFILTKIPYYGTGILLKWLRNFSTFFLPECFFSEKSIFVKIMKNDFFLEDALIFNILFIFLWSCRNP